MVRSQCVDSMAYTLAFDGPDTGYVHVLPHGMQEGPLHVQGPLGFMRLEGVSVKGPPTVAFSRVFLNPAVCCSQRRRNWTRKAPVRVRVRELCLYLCVRAHVCGCTRAGPVCRTTAALNTLKLKGVRASLFVTGSSLVGDDNRGLASRAATEGHDLASSGHSRIL